MAELKIALSGQIYESSGVAYTYPDDLSKMNPYPNWVKGIPDARFLREIGEGDSCFSIRCEQDGISYAYTTFNRKDSRNGCAMVTLFLGNAVPKDTNILKNTLQDLSAYFLNLNTISEINDLDIYKKTKALREVLVDVAKSDIPNNDLKEEGRDAIRLFVDESGLDKFLANPIQDAYYQHSWIHFVAKSNYRVTTNYVPINNDIRQWYFVDGVGQTRYLPCGNKFSYSYPKKGGWKHNVLLTIGNQSDAYCTIDGNRITINSVPKGNVEYVKAIPIFVQDALTGQIIPEFCINGEVIKSDDSNKGIQFKEGEKSKKIKISADKYKTQEVTISSSDEEVRVSLSIAVTTLELRLRNNENKIVIGSIAVEEDNELWTELEKGKYDDSIILCEETLISRIKPWLMVVILFIIFIFGGTTGYVANSEINPAQDSTRHDTIIQTIYDTIHIIVYDTIKEIVNAPEIISINQKKTADATALAFLNNTDNNELWCIQNVRGSTSYTVFMTFLLEAKNFAFLDSKYDDIENETWIAAKKQIDVLRNIHGEQKVLNAIRSLNSESNGVLKNGTININRLKNLAIQ